MTDLLLVLAGLATPPLVGALAARTVLLLRVRAFERWRRRSETPHYARVDLPAIQRTPHEQELLRAYEVIAAGEHGSAKRLQDICISYLVAASAALCIAFLGTAASATVFEGAEWLHSFGAAVDLAALVTVLVGFLRTRVLRLQWLRARTSAEFLRQWGAVEGVFAPASNGFTTQIEAFLARNRDAVAAEEDPLVAGQILASARLVEISTMLSAATELTAERARLYLLARPIGQAKWFERSITRIEGQQKGREVVMLGLFTLALLAAATKFLVVVVFPAAPALAEEIAMLVLLVASGLGAASTSAYLGHNTRSVQHRYRAQRRSIEEWFARHHQIAVMARGSGLLSPAETVQLSEAVLSFETLMTNELVDWLAISTADGMDLGLS